jgi:hypothetical protein
MDAPLTRNIAMKQPQSDAAPAPAGAQAASPEAEVLRAIRDTAYGTIKVVVHQSRIVQITRSEKVRFDQTHHDVR